MPNLRDFKDLTEPQRAILERLECDERFTKTFYFTGGTLLKALGIVPRESNDLDFFTFPDVDGKVYTEIIGHVKDMLCELFGESNVKVAPRGFSLTTAKSRVECVYDSVDAIEKFAAFGNLKTSGLKDLMANKSAAFCVRDEIKDYIDLAFITKREGVMLAELADIAEQKFGMQTISEEKLITEFLSKRDMFEIKPEMFLRDPYENVKLVNDQVEYLLSNTSL